VHPADELGRVGARGDVDAGDSRTPPGVGARGIVLFVAGLLFGALAVYYVLWRTGGLTPGHFASLTTSDLTGATRAATSPPLATIPFPAATATPLVAPGGTFAETPTPAAEKVETPPAASLSAAFSTLEGRTLAMPVVGAKTLDLRDNFEEARGSRKHEALDILAPRGTQVVAVDEGKVAKLFTSKQGGLTVYQFDRDETHSYYYAHLDRYAEGLHEGAFLARGDPIGYVGNTGNAPPNAPHLHFAIFELGPEKRWWEGKPLNPYPFLMKVK
jgi:murein DD-endopeptidase MepM/ murein hydrolase activator NlpD